MLSSNYSTVEQGAKAVLLPGLLLLPMGYVVAMALKLGLQRLFRKDTLSLAAKAHSASEADLRQSITDQHLQDTIRVSDPGAAHVHAVRDSVYNSF